MASKSLFDVAAFEKAYVKQRNAQLEHDLVLAQTKLRYLMEHVGSDIVPLPPQASFLSEKERHDIKKEVADTYDNSIDKLVADEQKKTPRSSLDQIRHEVTNGMVYYMFYYVLKLQSQIDPSLLWELALLIPRYFEIDHLLPLHFDSQRLEFLITSVYTCN